MRNRLLSIWGFLKVLYQHFFESNCPARAASLAYTTLLSIVPLVLLTFSILSLFPQLSGAGKEIEHFILNNFVASSADVIEKHLQTFVTHIKKLSWTNICALGVISVLLLYNMVRAVNHIWQVRIHGRFALSFIVYVIVLLISPVVFGALLLFSSYLTSLPIFSHVINMSFVKKPILYVSPFLIEWVAFSLFNWIIPSTRVQLRFACIAGFITAILFESAKIGFVQYVHYFPTYRLVYGALATIPIFLIWIYLSWLIIILGALICHLLQSKKYLRQN